MLSLAEVHPATLIFIDDAFKVVILEINVAAYLQLARQLPRFSSVLQLAFTVSKLADHESMAV